jgi:predicted dithiol-disulfide oxidoreductase (DUF899 family)
MKEEEKQQNYHFDTKGIYRKLRKLKTPQSELFIYHSDYRTKEENVGGTCSSNGRDKITLPLGILKNHTLKKYGGAEV